MHMFTHLLQTHAEIFSSCVSSVPYLSGKAMVCSQQELRHPLRSSFDKWSAQVNFTLFAPPLCPSKMTNPQDDHAEALSPRSYQVKMFERALAQNTIAVMDTGTGKTLVAAMLVKEMKQREKEYRAGPVRRYICNVRFILTRENLTWFFLLSMNTSANSTFLSSTMFPWCGNKHLSSEIFATLKWWNSVAQATPRSSRRHSGPRLPSTLMSWFSQPRSCSMFSIKDSGICTR